MLDKIIKIFFVCQLALVCNCSAQDTGNYAQNKLLVHHYNAFLQSLRLDTLLKATDFSFQKDTGFKSEVTMLTLSPQPGITSAFDFAEKWKHIRSAAPGRDIYQLLFTKLVAYSGLPPDELAVRFRFDDSNILVFTVSFDHLVKVNGQFISGRDAELSNGPGELDDIAYGGVLPNIPQRADFDQWLISKLKTAFQTYKHQSAVEVQSKSWGPGILGFRISNVRGEVTPNLNEVITVNIFVQSTGRGQMTVSFLFTVLCAGGILEPPSGTDSYSDAVIGYKKEVTAFGIRFKQQLRACLNSP